MREHSAQTKEIETSVGRLVITTLGAATPSIVLWSGLFFDDRQHIPLARQLALRGHSIALVNPPGFGGSGVAETVTMEGCGDALLEVAKRLGATSCFVGGTSWGGIAAIHGALREPTLVRGLLLFNTPIAGGTRRGLFRWIPTLAALPAHLFAMGAAASLFGRSTRARFRSVLTESMRAASGASARRMADLVLHRRPDLTERLAGLSVPALVILGDEDAMYPAASLRAAWSGVAEATVVEVKGTGHSSALEAPELVAAAVDSFIRPHAPAWAAP